MKSRNSNNTLLIIFSIIALSCATATLCVTFNATVAQDGSADFKTVSEAVSVAPRNSKSRYRIRVKPGRYFERVVIDSDMTNLSLIGDDPKTTFIVFNRSNATGFGTNDTASLSVSGDGFVAESLTIENSAGPGAGQAAALYNDADKTAFYLCNIAGYQDTLYANGVGNRQFYKKCTISGTVDFIFGSAKSFFQDCLLLARRSGPENIVTAQQREGPNEESGFVFQGCRVAASPEIKGKVTAYLGRPWRIYAKVIFMQCELDGIVAAAGWERWDNTSSVDLLFFAEYCNSGVGAVTAGRVKWKGVHLFKNPSDVVSFTVNSFIGGNVWLPETGVPFRGGLDNKPCLLADM